MVALTRVAAGRKASSDAPWIVCASVSFRYLGTEVLRDITFEIAMPSVYVVLGPNGAGKTTLFRTLAGILSPSRGKVTIGGAPGEHQTARDRLHYLSHLDGLPEGFTVREALAFYARAEQATEDDIERVLDKLQIRGLSGSYLGKLSSGQKKRVSIARIFLRERDIYLLDEPTANLDPKVAKEIRSLILELEPGQGGVVLIAQPVRGARDRKLRDRDQGGSARHLRPNRKPACVEVPIRPSIAKSFGLRGRMGEGGRVFRPGAHRSRGGPRGPPRSRYSRGEASGGARNGQSSPRHIRMIRSSIGWCKGRNTFQLQNSSRIPLLEVHSMAAGSAVEADPRCEGARPYAEALINAPKDDFRLILPFSSSKMFT